MPRHMFDVIPAPLAVFVVPRSSEEGERQKGALQAEVEGLHAKLAAKNRYGTTGQRLSEEEYNRVRAECLRVLNTKQQQLRELKKWLAQKNSKDKPSEWALLARAHQIIDGLVIPPEQQEEADKLLDAIEYVVPAAFLAAALERTG